MISFKSGYLDFSIASLSKLQAPSTETELTASSDNTNIIPEQFDHVRMEEEKSEAHEVAFCPVEFLNSLRVFTRAGLLSVPEMQ